MSPSKGIMNDPDLRLYLQRLSVNAMWGTRVSKKCLCGDNWFSNKGRHNKELIAKLILRTVKNKLPENKGTLWRPFIGSY